MMTSKAKSARRASASSPELGLFDLIAAVGQLLGDGLPQRGLVFDEQQMFRWVSHLAGANILTHLVRGEVARFSPANPAVVCPFNRYQPTEANSW